MTLRCECGGRVEVREGSNPDTGGRHWESYRCVECGGTGTYRFGDGYPDETTGCLTKGNMEVFSGP